MKKDEYIKEYGEAAYEKMLQQNRDWNKKNCERARETSKLWAATNPEKTIAHNREVSHKGGKYYERHQKYFSTGLPHEKNLVRKKHGYLYRPYKRIIAPDSQLHHEWSPGTADYTGVALVEKDAHIHGFVDVIRILEGEITLLTEAEIKEATDK